MDGYVNIYQGTNYGEMDSVSPWLVHLRSPEAEPIQSLLNSPEQNWGWLASAEHLDLTVLTQHWRDRMLIEEQGQRSLTVFRTTASLLTISA